jgi:endoglycosylceramidase
VQAAWENLYEDPDRRAEQIDGFMYVVERVAGHPALLGYDLLNEPFGKMREGETLITAAFRVEATQITPMYQRLTDAIRTVDTESWIFIEPPNLASLGVKTNLGPIDDDKVVVYPHLYDIGLESGGTYDPASPFLANYEAVITHYPETFDVPMMIGEWGLPDPGIVNSDQYVGGALAMLERVASGWTHFTWCKGGGYCTLDETGAFHPAWQLLVQAWPRAIAGAPTASQWDSDALSLRVTYRDRDGSSGPTEIVVPPSLYGEDGFVVESSAAAGEWSYDYDEETGRLTVDVAHDTGTDRAICVSPAGVAGGCTVEAPPVDPPDAPPTAPPADPIDTEADFTG